MTTHHVLYLGYGHGDSDFLDILRERGTGQPLAHGAIWRPPSSYNVMGPEERGIDRLFTRHFNINPVKVTLEEFMSTLYKTYTASRRGYATHPLDIFEEALKEAPGVFIKNCCLASMVGEFPVELLQWELKDREAGKRWFNRFFTTGLLEPVIRMGDQWFRLHNDVIKKCIPRIKSNREVCLERYLRFLGCMKIS